MSEWKGHILLSIPTFGSICMEFFANIQLMHVPINFGISWHLPQNLPVAEARTLAVEQALNDRCKYVFFRDYDVLAPPNALNVLMARDADVIAAPYVSKQKPPWPLILKGDGPTMAWRHGDVVQSDAIGMGCTLIKTEIFERLPKPWFKTAHGEHEDKGLNAPAKQSWTEDVFFCRRISDELGIKPLTDTTLFSVHKDLKTGEKFFYDPERHQCVWMTPDGTVYAVPPVDSDLCEINDQSTKEAEAE